jgi:hypothetical protein
MSKGVVVLAVVNEEGWLREGLGRRGLEAWYDGPYYAVACLLVSERWRCDACRVTTNGGEEALKSPLCLPSLAGHRLGQPSPP